MQQNPNQEELHTLQRWRQIQRAVWLRSDACHLREVAAHLTLRGPRRSLQIQWQRDNTESIWYRGAPGIPSSYTGKTIIGSTVALPLQAITLSSTPPASPRPPPVRPRVLQRIHPSTTKRQKILEEKSGCHNNSVPHMSNKKESLTTHTPIGF